ncbi:hypothetical protein N7523_007959 [Penicillium sp. IBT 18751x]|nr:hypothetical protein N7523_007959 [Penicillium sp. IBT 18751x]
MRPLSALALHCLLGLSTASITSDSDPVVKNAHHIFNVIHDSMRQWGSSLHHNGVSFFLATVPAGTQLYHGTSKSDPVNGTEWLAFEPEHAMVFARPRGGPYGPGGPGGPHGPGGPPQGEDGDNEDDEHRSEREELRRRHPHGSNENSIGLPPFEERDGETSEGYLHTYAAVQDLRLLYIDGMSAAKTQKGTLDSQDVLLFNGTIDKSTGRGPVGEGDRARKACEMAENDWAGRIDGVLRMEAGFEIILCKFERDLLPVRITQVKARAQGGHEKGEADREKYEHRELIDGKRRGPGGPGGGDAAGWMRAVTARYDDIGANRVFINYENFVTAFAHDVDLFTEDTKLPRLSHLTYSELKPIQKGIAALALTHDARESSWNWRATTDAVVIRYSHELTYLASAKISTIDALHEHVEKLLSPFIDYSERDSVLEADRCATQFLPVQLQGGKSIAARVIYNVAHTVCSTLMSAWAEQELTTAQNAIQNLIADLDWTTWKECRGCEDNEICVVPIWPMGTVEDYNNPRCKPASNPYDGKGENYWGGMHP